MLGLVKRSTMQRAIRRAIVEERGRLTIIQNGESLVVTNDGKEVLRLTPMGKSVKVIKLDQFELIHQVIISTVRLKKEANGNAKVRIE